VRLHLKVTTFYSGLGSNIHGTAPIYNYFYKSVPTPNKNTEDGGMLPFIVDDWVGQKTSNNSEMCIMDNVILNINKIFKATLRFNNLFLKLEWFK